MNFILVNVEVQEVAASVPKNETEITSKDESSEAHTETSPVKQIPESTVPETEVEVTPQHPAISTVLDEIPPPPPTPPLVNEAPVEPQQTEVEPEVEQRLTESVKESDVPPPLPPTPPPVIESTPSVPTECEPETRTEQITDDIVPPPPPPVESDEVKQAS